MESFISKQMDTLDLAKIGEQFDRIFPEFEIDIEKLFMLILKGKIHQAFRTIADTVFTHISEEIFSFKFLLISILLVGILSGVMSHFSDLFSNGSLSQMGFYILYLSLTSVLMKGYLFAEKTATEVLQNILLFIQCAVPVFTISIGTSLGIQAAGFYYEVFLFSVWVVEKLVLNILIPGINCYVILAFLNGIIPQERLTPMMALIRKGIEFVLKVITGFILGTSLVQSTILPALSGLKTITTEKIVSAIPGIGELSEGMTEVFLGSALLIKNSMGILLLILLVIACMIPMVRIGCVSLLMRASGAMVNLVSDKRISSLASEIGTGCFLLLHTVFMAVVLFVVLIGIISGVRRV